MKGTQKVVLEKITNIILDILLVIFGLILLITIYRGIQVKVLGKSHADFFGLTIFEVQTGSMANTIGISDWIVVKSTTDIEVNDIITYEKDGEFITHRVVEKYKGTYITKGDANNSKDDPVSQEQILGKVVSIIPKMGIIRKTIFNPLVLLLLIITVYFFNFAFRKRNKEIDSQKKFDVLMDKILDRMISNIDKENKIKNEKKALKEQVKVTVIEDVTKNDTPAIVTPVEIKEEPKEEVKEMDALEAMLADEEESKVETPVEVLTEETPSEEKIITEDNITPEEAKELHEKLDEMTTSEDEDDELSKTMLFRSISVNANELTDTFGAINRNQALIDYEEKMAEEEAKARLQDEEEREAMKEADTSKTDSLIEEELEMLQKKDKRKFSNVIDRVFYLKEKELEEINDILNDGKKLLNNEPTIRDGFIKAYIDGKYYNHCGDANADYTNRNMLSKLNKLILETDANMINSYKGNDKGYANKVNKYANIFTIILSLEYEFQNNDAVADVRNAYLTILDKYFRKRNYIPKRQYEIINAIIKVQKSYQKMRNFVLKKVKTEMFEVTYSPLSTNRKLVGVDLKHNVEFSKVYSDYIINKTYSEGIIAEDKVFVLLSLLSAKITEDILDSEYSKKYIMYIPGTLYGKDNKVSQLMKVMSNEFLKNNIYILCQFEDLMGNKKVIKNLKKVGFRFALSLDEAVLINDNAHAMINIVDYIFINKKKFDAANIIPNLPEEAAMHVISEDIGSKVGNYGGEF